MRNSPPTEDVNLEHILFIKILRNVRTCSMQEGGRQCEAVCGGLIVIVVIPQLGSLLPDSDPLETFFIAMEKNSTFHVKKAAYDVVLTARDGWLRSGGLNVRPMRISTSTATTWHSDSSTSVAPTTNLAFLPRDDRNSIRGRVLVPLPRGTMYSWGTTDPNPLFSTDSRRNSCKTSAREYQGVLL